MFTDLKLKALTVALKSKLKVPLPLRIELWSGEYVDLSSEPSLVTVRVPQVTALRHLMSPSLYNLGRAYVEGDLDISGRAADMITIASALAETSDEPARRAAKDGRHTRESDSESIQYHYDVSNAFYQSFLDPAMVYSCAYYENGEADDLASAQIKKIDHILRKIDLQRGHTLLDIGCGWGALVIRAAQQYGVRCVGVTLSENQAKLARERVTAAGLEDLVEIRLQDYRDVGGQFDRITSVGMFEHVGTKNLPAYFEKINTLLAPGGVVMNHGITSTDVEARNSPYGGGEFIDEYVFPNGELAHLGDVVKAMQQGGLEVRDIENLRRHYARTCAEWTENFEKDAEHIKTLTDPKKFRIWHVYLAGCAYGFAHDWISLYQIVCSKAEDDVGLIPWSRNYMYK